MTADDALKRLLNGELLEPDEEAAALAALAKHPGALLPFATLLVHQRRRLRRNLDAATQRCGEAEARLAALVEPPLLPARVLRALGDGRLDVAASGRRVVVGVLAELASEPLAPGDEVLLDAQGATAVARMEGQTRTGLLGAVLECAEGRVLIQGAGGEEILARAAPGLEGRIAAGDRVVYLAELPIVVDRLPAREASRYDLERVPETTFDEIGGLDEIVAELRRDIDMHLVHPEIARRFGLAPLRGVTFVGPPGVGKTLLGKAVANHLARAGRGARFLEVKPGALRGSLYGQTEGRIRDLFARARSAPGLCVVFLDEIDTFGSRGEGVGLDIDARVLPALLAEIDGLTSCGNVLCIGATNRLDLCDPALVRPGRLLDRRYEFPRPGREAARAILERHLRPELPYAECGREAVLEAAASHLYSPAAGALATLTFANGEQQEVRPRDVVGGALLASAAERAKYAAAARAVDGRETGVGIEDLLEALEQALASEAEKLRAVHVARRVLVTARADEIVRVEPARRPVPRHRILRAA
jgi:proteasome-associated ATPase